MKFAHHNHTLAIRQGDPQTLPDSEPAETITPISPSSNKIQTHQHQPAHALPKTQRRNAPHLAHPACATNTHGMSLISLCPVPSCPAAPAAVVSYLALSIASHCTRAPAHPTPSPSLARDIRSVRMPHRLAPPRRTAHHPPPRRDTARCAESQLQRASTPSVGRVCAHGSTDCVGTDAVYIRG